MAILFRLEDGQTEEVASDEITSAVGSGKYTFVKGAEIPVIAPDGTPGTIPAEHAKRLFEKGYRYEGEEGARVRQIREEVRGEGPATAAISAADMALGGLLTTGLKQTDTSGKARERIRLQREENPWWHAGGSIAGAFVPGGLGSTAAKTGANIGTALTKGLGAKAGKSLLSRAIRTGTALGVGGAVEGAAVGGQALVSEEALGNIEYSAESFLSTVGTGALLGGVLGAVSGAGKAALRSRKAGKLLEARKARTVLNEAGGEVVEGEAKAGLVQKVSRGAAARALRLNSSTLRKIAKKAKGGRGKARSRIDEALDIAIDTPHPDGGRIIRAGRTTEDVAERLGETVHHHGVKIREFIEGMDDVVAQNNVSSGRQLSRNEIARRLREAAKNEFKEAANKSAKKKLLDLADGIEGASGKEGAKGRRVLNLGEAAGTVSDDPIGAAYGRTKDELSSAASGGARSRVVITPGAPSAPKPMSFAEAQAERAALGKAWRGSMEEGTVKDAMRKAERIIADEIDSKADDIAGEFAPDGLEAWRESKKIFSALADMAENSDAQALRDSFSNNYLSLTSKIGGSAFGAGKLAIGDSGLASAAQGGATALAIQFAKERGASTFHVFADKLTKLNTIKSAASKMDNRVGRAVNSLFSRQPAITKTLRRGAVAASRAGKKVTKTAARGTVESTSISFAGDELGVRKRPGVPIIPASVTAILSTGVFKAPAKKDESVQIAAKRWSKELANAVSRPEDLADRASVMVADSDGHAPKVSSQAALLSVKRVQFLNSKAPKPPPHVGIGDVNEDWTPSRAESAKFARYVAAAMDPSSVMNDMENGILSPEGVEVLRELYPKTYEKLKMEIVKKAAEKGHELPYTDKIQLSLLFGVPLHYTMTPDFIRQAQQSFQPTPTKGRGGGGMRVTGVDKITLAERTMTDAQAREMNQ